MATDEVVEQEKDQQEAQTARTSERQNVVSLLTDAQNILDGFPWDDVPGVFPEGTGSKIGEALGKVDVAIIKLNAYEGPTLDGTF